MTFLNPFLLLGLAAAAIPIILHLINLRKLRTIEFSTLSFLKELQRTKIRRLKIRQLLLLILRTLLVVLLVLGFSRPTLKGTVAEGIGSRAKTSAVIIIDDSQSMGASDEHGELLKQAREAAAIIIDLMSEGDEVILLRLSALREGSGVDQFPPMRSFPALRSALAQIKPSSIHRKLDHAMRFSAKLLSASRNFNREVYLISDFQKGALEPVAAVGREAEDLFPPQVRFFLVHLGERPPHNLGIGETGITSAILERDRPFVVKTQIGNYSTQDVRNHVVSVFLNGTRVAQKGLDIRSGQVLDTEFSVVPKSTGIVEGFVELENDDLDYDNRRYFSASIPERLRVLLVGKPEDLRYLRLALAARQTTQSAVQLQETGPDRLTASSLGSTDMVILSNVRSLSAPQAEGLGAFVEAGGGLMIVPGADNTPSAFNLSFAPLKLPPFVGKESVGSQGTTGEATTFLTFDRVELRHPLFEGMFEKETPVSRRSPESGSPSVESPLIRSFVRFAPSATSTTIISLTNGSPFLLEHRLGSGRILLLAVAASLEWSDFPLKGLFVPLLHQAVLFLTQQQTRHQHAMAGEEVVLRSLPAAPGRITVEDPMKVEVVVHPTRSGMTRILRFDQTSEVGLYKLKAGTTTVRTFSVNIDPGESNTLIAESPAIERMFRGIGIGASALRRISQKEEVRRVVLEARYGTELWKHFLVAALFVALTEMFIAREARRDAGQPVLSSPGGTP